MTAVVQYGDPENVTKRWLAGTDVALLVTRSPGAYSIYLAMPKSAPIPAVVLSLVSGRPTARKDLPEGTHRLQFDCWGKSRDEAGFLSRTLINELESLSQLGGYIDVSGTYLGCASVQAARWLPDPNSDTPRYIVDALITTVA